MTRRSIAIALGLAAAVGMIWVGWSYAYTRVFWPRSIQHTLLGEQIANYADLRNFSDERGPFGEGFLRWTYNGRRHRLVEVSVCRRFAKKGCSFVLSRELGEGVTVTIEVRDGRELTISEFWS